jgi:hypothetical protein
VRSVRPKVKIAPNKVIMTDSLKRKREPERGSAEALNKIHAKQLNAISKPVLAYKAGQLVGTYPSRQEAGRALQIAPSLIHYSIAHGSLVHDEYTFKYDDFHELKKDKKWFKARGPDGNEYEGDVRVTLCGWIQVEGRRPTLGTLTRQGYRVIRVEGHQIKIHRIMWATWNDKAIPEGYQIDHIDGNRQNNHCSNLKLYSPRDHAIKTRRTTNLSENMADSQSFSVRLVESRDINLDPKLVGQVMKTSQWARTIPGLTTRDIKSSYYHNCFIKKLYKFERVRDELLENEEFLPTEGDHWILSRDGTQELHYRVTTLGRFEKQNGDIVGGESGRQVRLSGIPYQIHTLVCLAKEGLHEVPEGKTVDHIHGIDGQEWPDRPSNLRFATASEQMQNRAPRPTTDGPGPE